MRNWIDYAVGAERQLGQLFYDAVGAERELGQLFDNAEEKVGLLELDELSKIWA